MGPFLTAMGAALADVPPVVAALHSGQPERWAGRVTVERATGLAHGFACYTAGFPPAMTDAPFALRLRCTATQEIWERDFDGHVTRSVLYSDGPAQLRERLGAITLRLRPELSDAALTTHVLRAHLFGVIPLPKSITPRGEVRIWQDQAARYAFDIAGIMPGLGRIIRYHGWLLPAGSDQR